MGYGHRYYSDAERLKAVKGYINGSIPVSKYAKIIIVNAKLLEIGYGLLEALNIKILSIEDLLSYLKKLNNLKLNPTVKICHIPPQEIILL